MTISSAPPELSCQRKLDNYANFPVNNWKEWRVREILLDWLMAVSQAFDKISFIREFSKAIYLVDRVQELLNPPTEQVQLYALASYYLGHYGSLGKISLDDLSAESDDAISRQEIAEAIQEVLQLTYFDLASTNPYSFLDHQMRNSSISKTVRRRSSSCLII